MIVGLSCRVNETSGPLRCASYTESHIEGVSPRALEKPFAHEPTVLTWSQYRPKNNDGSSDEIKVDGVFIAIGHTPNTSLFEGQLTLKDGYLVVNGGREGNATATNFGAAMGAFGGGVGGGLGGFSRSPEGKATVAAFMDAYNNMVISLRNYKAQEVKGGLGRGGQLKVGK